MFFNEIEIIKILNLIPGGKNSGNTTVKILKIVERYTATTAPPTTAVETICNPHYV